MSNEDEKNQLVHKNPCHLSDKETIEFILRPVYHGIPEPLHTPAGKRGPKIKQTQYDLSKNLRRYHYHKLVELPQLHKNGMEVRLKIGDSTRELIQKIGDMLASTTPPHKLARAVYEYLLKDPKLPQHDIKTVRTNLNKTPLR